MPNAARKFTEASIRLFDTSRLKPEVNKEQWATDLKKLRWYGPFNGGENRYYFQTATESGNFEGLLIDISLR